MNSGPGDDDSVIYDDDEFGSDFTENYEGEEEIPLDTQIAYERGANTSYDDKD